MKNGAETKVIAMITAIVVNGTEIPSHSNGADEEAAPAEHQQQREPGDGRRQDDREVHDRLDQALAAKVPSREDEGQGQAHHHRDHEADRAS